MATDEKKFVIKHVFEDLKSAGDYALGKTVKKYDIAWRVYAYARGEIKFECFEFTNSDKWSVDVEVDMKLPENPDFSIGKKQLSFYNINTKNFIWKIENEYLINRTLSVEVHVEIKNMSGIRKRNPLDFSGSRAQEASDVVLIVESQKFHVNKKYLAFHSTYFKALFSGNFVESEKAEIELKDVDSEDFQDFLELIYGVSSVDDVTYDGILKLADMYDAKTAAERCEDFLQRFSKKSNQEKFDVSIQYKLTNLTKKCISEMKTREEIRSVMPDDPSKLENWVWKELCLKLISIQ